MEDSDEGGLPPLQRAFLDWLLTPELEREGDDKCSQNEWARSRGMAASTLHRWKNDPRFISEWEKRYVEIQTQPDRIAAVLESMWTAATNGDVQAAKEWLRWMDKMSPQKPVDREAETEVTKMPTGALLDELTALIESLRPDSGTN